MVAESNFVKDLIVEGFGPAVGVFFGFIFGWILHEIQAWRERSRRGRLGAEKRLIELKSAHALLWSIINEVLITKDQLFLSLAEETESIKTRYANWANATPPTAVIHELEAANSFFQSFEEVGHDITYDLDKIRFIAADRVEVIQMIVDLKIALRALDSFTKQRNAMLEKYANTATAGGLTEMQLRYFVPMLVTLSEALIAKQDYALYFMRNLAEVINDYAVRQFPDRKFNTVRFENEKLEKLMPPRNLIANYYPAAKPNVNAR